MTKTSKKLSRSRFKVGCLFAAIGGFARAFQESGATVAWANEKDNQATLTFRANFPNVKHYHKPIEKLNVLADQMEAVDIFTAGFPCQPFSIAGEKRGFEDERGELFLEIIRLIQEFGDEKPKVLVMENVKNLKAHDKGRTFQRIQMEIQKAGYWFTDANAKILNTATHTTIPQNRERIFMVALSNQHFSSNKFEFPPELPKGSMQPVKKFLDLTHKAEKNLYFEETSQYYSMFDEAVKKGGNNVVYQLRRSYVRQNKSGMCFTLMANMGEGAVAKRLHRNWIGLEREEKYIKVAQKRIDAVQPEMFDPQIFDVRNKSKSAPKVEFSVLVENGFLEAGQKLFFSKDKSRSATIKPDARVRTADGFEGSIHQTGSHYMNGSPCNGWEHWYLQENGGLISLDDVRQRYRIEKGLFDEQPS